MSRELGWCTIENRFLRESVENSEEPNRLLTNGISKNGEMQLLVGLFEKHG